MCSNISVGHTDKISIFTETMERNYLACDLGADSGRLIGGSIHYEKLSLHEIHRFPNGPVRQNESLHWDIDKLFNELVEGLRRAGSSGNNFSSISCDSWGVDYVLYDDSNRIIKPVYHYRDQRCVKGVEIVKAKIPWEEIFKETGIQFMQLNTIYQLATESKERLASARMLLCIGDAFLYYLSNCALTEESLASTTQLYNPITKNWSYKLIDILGLPRNIFTRIVPSGTILGPMKQELIRNCGLNPMEVIASCSHDTGAAVAAVPAEGDDWAYLSSGTWSLMGVELASPVINDASRTLNFTNEIGYGGSVRFLKNIIGLWLIQECRRHWNKSGFSFSFADLENMAKEAPAFVSLINPADPRFIAPDNMPEKIADFCKETSQPVPKSPAATVRCIYESLALLYKRTLLQIEQVIKRPIRKLHIVGGGSKDSLLNQFSANATQVPVYAGPAEATATGNIIIQAIALGHIKSLDEARRLVKNSSVINVYKPSDSALWDKAYERFEKLFK